MAFSKYVLEIKNRLFLLILTGLSSFTTSYLYKETLLFVLIQSQTLLSETHVKSVFYFIFTDVTEIFSVYLQLLTFLTFQILIFDLIYHTFLFFSPALYKKEYYNLKFGLWVMVVALWISSILLIHLFIPLTWNFFLSFQSLNFIHLHFEAKLSEYLNFCIFLYFLCLFYCQIFAIFLILSHNLNANITFIRKIRKLCYFFLVVFSTLISPPDVLSQLLFSFFLSITYEILLLISLYKSAINKLN